MQHVGNHPRASTRRLLFLSVLALQLSTHLSATAAEGQKLFRAGAFAIDVTPTHWPVIINGSFLEAKANKANDPLHARCLVLDDGETRVGLCVLDSCLIPREFSDAAKREIQKATGLPPERVMISATHTHAAPSLMRILGTDEDPTYTAFLLPRLVEGFRQAVANLAPAQVGWASIPAPEHTHTRVWVRRPDRVGTDPFGENIVRANMHPGHQNPDAIAPSGPSDPDLSLLAVQTPDGLPIAVFANYSMHYHGGIPAVSADYFGRFATQLGVLLGATNQSARPFVGIMSQGTSGDQQWMDYSQPVKNTSIDAYAAALAELAHRAYRTIAWQDWVPIAMRDRDLMLRTRQPSEKRLTWARGLVETFKGRTPKSIPEVYAREQVWLHENPVRAVKLQALRIGELGLVTAAAEVFAISGLKVKAQSPLRSNFFVELANGEEGYIPPPEHHSLGSYNTWACRSAGLEIDAETKIVDTLLSLLEEVSGRKRLPFVDPPSDYSQAIETSKPIGYWRMNEFDGRRPSERTGRGPLAISESGVVFGLEGPPFYSSHASNGINRGYHFAGGRVKAAAKSIGTNYSVELWFWNGLPHEARETTGYLFSRGTDKIYGAPGEHLSIGGTRTSPGRLVFSNGGSDISRSLVGQTVLTLKTWNHLVLVRAGTRVTAYLNGDPTPELVGDIPLGVRSEVDSFFIGGRSDGAASFEGRMDEVSLFDRSLTPEEIAAHFKSARIPPPVPAHSQRARVAPTGSTAAAISALNPAAHWLQPPAEGARLIGEPNQPQAQAEEGVQLPGAAQMAARFSGGRLRATVPKLGTSYSVAFWFYNELPNSARSVTAYLFSRGEEGASDCPGEHLGIGGTHSNAGQLILFNGNQRNELLSGNSVIAPESWNHVLLVRDGGKVSVYLNGQAKPEISGVFTAGYSPGVNQIFLGGRSDQFSNLRGQMNDIALFDRALKEEEIARALQAVRHVAPRSSTQAATAKPGPSPVASQPLSPVDSLKKIHVRQGYQVDLVAAEPLLESPVAIDWDERGRLWVVEMVDYPLGLDGKGKPGGRVRILEDLDGDGHYDKSTLFAEGLVFPTGILTWRDGVILTAAPEILFLKDSDGDGKADVRTVLFSGFFEANQQLRVNGLRWGLDNWVYCASGAHHGGYGTTTKIKSHLNGKEYAIGSRDFRFRPDTGELDPQSGPSQFGRNPDDWGNWFGVQNSWPLWHYVLQDHYLRRNPHTAAPDPVLQIVKPSNPRVYPASPSEKRFHSFDQAGHFTSACAAMIYRDTLLFGAGSDRHAFTCEPFHNLVQHNVIQEDGVSFTSQRAPEETPYDFFASEDRWCRPVMTRAGPDGALWVVDMYRYMIEHPEWLPPEGKADLLPHYRLGEERGRIYRVFPRSMPPRRTTPLGSLSLPELVAALDTPNGWQRDKVQMLLLWKGDTSITPALVRLAQESPNATTRLQALCTLDGLGQLQSEAIGRALKDSHPGVRAHALRLSENQATGDLIGEASALASDSDPKVLLQAAYTLGTWDDPRAGAALGQIAVSQHANRFITAAVMSSALRHSLALVDAVVRVGGPALATYSDRLLTLALATQHRDSIGRLLEPSLRGDGTTFTPGQIESFRPFLETLAQRQTRWEQFLAPANPDALHRLLTRVPALFAEAKKLASDSTQPEAQRVMVAGLLARDTVHRSEALPLLAALLTPQTSGSGQRVAIQSLGATADDAVPSLLVKAWPALSPETRWAAADQLLGREPWCFALAQAIETRQVHPMSLDAARQGRLLRHASARVKEAAQRALRSEGHSTRAKAIESFQSATTLSGKPGSGALVFAKLCATCHKLGDIGNDIGPNLQSVANHPPEKLLISILDPNASIEPGFTAYSAELTGGEDVYGIIAAETGNSLVMKLPDGKTRTLLRSDVKDLRSASLSLMPEGLEAGLSPQDLADLIAHLKNPSQP